MTGSPTPIAQTDASAGPAPLSHAQLQLLSSARQQHGQLRTARSLAAFNGWSLLLCGIFATAGAALGLGSVWLGALIIGFGVIELHGRARLRALDPVGTTVLAVNQVALLAAVWIYCAVAAYEGQAAQPGLADSIGQHRELIQVMQLDRSGNLDDQLASAARTYRRAVILFYTGLAFVTLLFQGGCAYYYYTRRGPLEALRQTPAWARELVATD